MRVDDGEYAFIIDSSYITYHCGIYRTDNIKPSNWYIMVSLNSLMIHKCIYFNKYSYIECVYQ